MPILSSFCVFCAVGMLSLFVIQATFFPACLCLDQKRIRAGRDGVVPCYTHKNYKPNRFSNVEILEPFFKKVWARLLLSIPGKVSITWVCCSGFEANPSRAKPNCSRRHIYFSYVNSSNKIRKYEKYQVLFFVKTNEKIFKALVCCGHGWRLKG